VGGGQVTQSFLSSLQCAGGVQFEIHWPPSSCVPFAQLSGWAIVAVFPNKTASKAVKTLATSSALTEPIHTLTAIRSTPVEQMINPSRSSL
jgi:hypothetical protein